MKLHIKNGYLHRLYAKQNIRNKIIFSIYLLLVPILVISFAFFYYYNYEKTMQENTQIYQRFTQAACDEIAYLQQDVLDISTYFAVNAEVRNVLSSSPEAYDGNLLFWSTNTPLTFMQDILAIKSQIKTLILYPENGLNPFYQSRDTSVHNTDMNAIRQLEMYQKAEEANGDVVWFRVNAGDKGLFLRSKFDKIVGCKMIFDLSRKNTLAFLVLGMEVSAFEEVCESKIQLPGEGIVVLGPEGDEFIRTGQISEEVLGCLQEQQYSFSGGSSAYEKISGYYVFRAKEEQTGISVYYMSPKSIWNAKMMDSLLLPTWILLVLLIGTWPLSYIVSRALARPMAKLHDSMEKFKNGDFDQYIEVENQDEIGQLAMTFNQMVQDIKSLIDKNYVMQLREKNSELDALQAKINPHFLYNVLDSLYWQAVGDGNDKIAEDILSLSTLFRMLLSQGQSEIPVRAEIELVRSYLKIQNMRFAKKMTFQIDVEDDIMEEIICKLTLQPFVENAVVHGLETSAEGGKVWVKGWRDGKYLHFTIKDNGVGMEQEEADRILLGEENRERSAYKVGGYAIRNIKERLKLRYGEDFSLNMYSRKSEGTCVEILIPVQEKGILNGEETVIGG